MFCPNCSAEERNQGQFCRSCGTELQAVRITLERPDSLTASAITAREEIGRAIAARIQELESADDLKQVVEDVLPQIEKFLESPEERRLRNFRNGMITSAIGIAVTLSFLLVSLLTDNRIKDMKPLVAVLGCGGFVVLLIGLSVIINARWFTVPSKEMRPPKHHTKQLEANAALTDRELRLDEQSNLSSVTEGTTRQLKQ